MDWKENSHSPQPNGLMYLSEGIYNLFKHISNWILKHTWYDFVRTTFCFIQSAVQQVINMNYICTNQVNHIWRKSECNHLLASHIISRLLCLYSLISFLPLCFPTVSAQCTAAHTALRTHSHGSLSKRELHGRLSANILMQKIAAIWHHFSLAWSFLQDVKLQAL